MSEKAWVKTRCVCAERHGEIISTKDGIGVVKCACGVLRTGRRPADYMTVYTEGEDYHAGQCQEIYGYPTYMERYEHDAKVAELRLQYYMPHFRSLDVGCANGAFVSALEARGWNAYGLEPNPAMARWASDRTGRPVFTSYEQVDATIGPLAFDLITYHDVFEHVIDPREELATIRRFLRTSGVLVIDVPDGAEVFGPEARAAHHEKPEQHMWYWTEATLRTLLANSSWVVQSVDRPIVGKLVFCVRPNA